MTTNEKRQLYQAKYRESIEELKRTVPDEELHALQDIKLWHTCWNDLLTKPEKKMVLFNTKKVVNAWLEWDVAERRAWLNATVQEINKRVSQQDNEIQLYVQRQSATQRTKSWAFDLLGLPEWADREHVRQAWQELVRKNHPKRGGDPAHFRNIQLAYETLIFST